MAADANQLQDLREFLLAGDEDSARRLTENLNPSSVVNVENVDFTKLPKGILGTSLIPVIDEPGHDDHRIAAQATGNGNCRTKHRHETKNIKAKSNRSLIRRLSRAVPF